MLDYSRVEGGEGDYIKIDGWVEVIIKRDAYVFGVIGG